MANEINQQLLRKKEVLRITGWCNTTLYNRIAAGTFARPVPIGPRSVAWPSTEVYAHVNSCIAARDSATSRSTQVPNAAQHLVNVKEDTSETCATLVRSESQTGD